MGFFLSLVYILTNYLTPLVLFGPLAQVHVELVLAFLILLVSIPQMTRSAAFKTPQTLALAGLSVSVFLSVLIATRWPGGAVNALLDFIPNIYAFFVLCLHFNSRKRLQVLVLMLLFVCLFVTVHGVVDLQRVGHSPPDAASPELADPDNESQASAGLRQKLWEIEHPYLFPMRDDNNNWFYRVRGLGVIHDPNDFGQILVCEIRFFSSSGGERRGCAIFSSLFCRYALCFTASTLPTREALSWRCSRSYYSQPAAVSGHYPLVSLRPWHLPEPWPCTSREEGRSQPVQEQAEELWGESLQILKSYPIFGIGMRQLPSYIGHTAHNSSSSAPLSLALWACSSGLSSCFPPHVIALNLLRPRGCQRRPISTLRKIPSPRASGKVRLLRRLKSIIGDSACLSRLSVSSPRLFLVTRAGVVFLSPGRHDRSGL